MQSKTGNLVALALIIILLGIITLGVRSEELSAGERFTLQLTKLLDGAKDKRISVESYQVKIERQDAVSRILFENECFGIGFDRFRKSWSFFVLRGSWQPGDNLPQTEDQAMALQLLERIEIPTEKNGDSLGTPLDELDLWVIEHRPQQVVVWPGLKKRL